MKRPSSQPNRTPRRRGRLAVIVAVVVLAGAFVTALPVLAHPSNEFANDPQWLLFVCQDEVEIERTISEFLKVRTEWRVNDAYWDDAETDLYLLYTFGFEDAPSLRVSVDTFITYQDEDDAVTERSIRVAAYWVVPDAAKTDKVRVRLLELINELHRRNTFPSRYFLDEDDDFAMQTWINLPGPNVPIHAEMIYDAIWRMQNTWEDTTWPALAELLEDVE